MADSKSQALDMNSLAEGDGSAAICCVGATEFREIRADEFLRKLEGERLDAFMAAVLAEGDGTAAICCVGNSSDQAR